MHWAQAEEALDATVASIFDRTPIRVLPRKEGVSVNQPRVADPSRVEFDALGTIEFGAPPLPGRIAADPSASAPVSFEAVLTALVSAWPYVPVRGDRVSSAGRLFDVAKVDRDGSDRAVVYLNSSR